MAADDEPGFLARWSRRKALARDGIDPPEPQPLADAATSMPRAIAAPAAAPAAALAQPAAAAPPAAPPPTLADVDALAPGADVRRFVAAGVDAVVRNAALKKLFADPHFNLMDGLDVYIDDYARPDPLSPLALRRLQSTLGDLARSDGNATACDEDPDLRLQSNDGAGPNGVEPGAVPHPGREP